VRLMFLHLTDYKEQYYEKIELYLTQDKKNKKKKESAKMRVHGHCLYALELSIGSGEAERKEEATSELK